MSKTSRIGLALVPFLGLAAALPACAQDYSASTTAAITAAGTTVTTMFFTNLPIVLGFVVAVILTLWGVRWILSQFHRGRK
jgi:hypothetical protein